MKNESDAAVDDETSLMQVNVSSTINDVLHFFVNKVIAHQQQINRAFNSLLKQIHESEVATKGFTTNLENDAQNGTGKDDENSNIQCTNFVGSLTKTIKASETLFRFLFECIYVHQLEANLAFAENVEEIAHTSNVYDHHNDNLAKQMSDVELLLYNALESARRAPLAVQRSQARYMAEMASMLLSTNVNINSNTSNNSANSECNSPLLSLPSSPKILTSSSSLFSAAASISNPAATVNTSLHDKTNTLRHVRIKGQEQNKENYKQEAIKPIITNDSSAFKNSVTKTNNSGKKECAHSQRQNVEQVGIVKQEKEGLERALKFSFAISSSYSTQEQESLMHMLAYELRVPVLILPRPLPMWSNSDKQKEHCLNCNVTVNAMQKEEIDTDTKNEESNHEGNQMESMEQIRENEARMALLLRCRYLITPHSPPTKPCVHFVKREVLEKSLRWSHQVKISSQLDNTKQRHTIAKDHNNNKKVKEEEEINECGDSEGHYIRKTREANQQKDKDRYEQQEEKEDEDDDDDDDDDVIFKDSELYELLKSLDNTLVNSSSVILASSTHNNKNNGNNKYLEVQSLPQSPITSITSSASSPLLLSNPNSFSRALSQSILRPDHIRNSARELAGHENRLGVTSLSRKRVRGTIERASWTQTRYFTSAETNTPSSLHHHHNNNNSLNQPERLHNTEDNNNSSSVNHDTNVTAINTDSVAHHWEEELVLVVPSQSMMESQCVTYWHHDSNDSLECEEELLDAESPHHTNNISCNNDEEVHHTEQNEEGRRKNNEECKELKTNVVYMFQISNTLKEMKPLLIEAIKKLGGHVDISAHFNKCTTHFVMLEGLPERTEKYLSCCAANVSIVPPRYVFESARRGYWMVGKSLLEFDMNPRRRHPRSWRSAPFAAWDVLLCTSNAMIASGIETVLRAGGCQEINKLLFDAAPQINRRVHEAMISNTKKESKATIDNYNHNKENFINKSMNDKSTYNNLEEVLNANSNVEVDMFNRASHILLECNTMAAAPYLDYFELPIWFPFMLRRGHAHLWDKLYTLEVLYYTLCTSTNVVFDEHDGKLISEDYLTHACRVAPSSFD